MSQLSPALASSSHAHPRPAALRILSGLLLCALLALVQISWAGYQLGFGNQGIQIAFLEALHDPQLFARDQMVAETLTSYPSYFFHFCAKLLALLPLPTLYLLLHFLATTGVFAGILYLSRSLFKSTWVPFIASLLLLAGHHQALAGESLYSAGFTHTWAVFPLSLLALGLFCRERYIEAFALAGAVVNLHALEGGHLGMIMGVVALCRIHRVGLPRLALACTLFAAAALPALILMATAHQQFDAEWLQLMHIRSADHSFPTSWWQPGTPDVPRFLCILALAAVAMSFPMRPRIRRTLLLVAAAVGLLFVLGTVLTEFWPVPTIIRAQLFRSSRLLLVIAFLVIAHGIAGAWRLIGQRPHHLAPWQIGLECASAVLTAATLALPSMLVLLPSALALSMLIALINGRLAWHQALAAGTALLVAVVAWETIQFVIPGLPPQISWRTVAPTAETFPRAGALALLLACIALWALFARPRHRLLQGGLLAAGAALAFLGLIATLPAIAAMRIQTNPWVEAQRWVRDNTPKDALFLTPPQQAGFRVYSQRAVVGEMRDGTQLYFKAAYSKPWWERMTALQPGLLPDPDGKSLMSPGKPLDRLDDAQIIALAKQFNADLIVLPKSDARGLEKLYDNGVWGVYRPQVAVVSNESRGVEMAEEDQFLRQTALPNIEKVRKSDVQIQLVDMAGQPLSGVRVDIQQTGSSFSFGASLPFFKQPALDIGMDYKPPAVTPQELTAFLDVFNYSVIQFSGQWRFLEPARGKPDYTDLDQYVDWCRTHNVRPEFHTVAGAAPAWAKGGDAPALLAQHATALAKRYADRILDWQIVSDKIAIDQIVPVAAAMRKVAPNARLALSDDTEFQTSAPTSQSQPESPAGVDDLRRLKKAGLKIDYFALQARHPTGLWASGADIYSVLDAFAAENTPVHITEFGVPVGARIEGDLREGRWTPQLQAEYYERFFTICFSHKTVEAINVMGIGANTWLPGQGLLDEKNAPTPAYLALKRLITQKWRTHATGATSGDGSLPFKGFHGTYKLTATPPGGKSATATFTVSPTAPNQIRLQYNPATHTLTEVH